MRSAASCASFRYASTVPDRSRNLGADEFQDGMTFLDGAFGVPGREIIAGDALVEPVRVAGRDVHEIQHARGILQAVGNDHDLFEFLEELQDGVPPSMSPIAPHAEP